MEREDYYLLASRLERTKGVHTVPPLIRKNGPRLRIAGAGEAEGALRAMAAGAPNIEFPGRVPLTLNPAVGNAGAAREDQFHCAAQRLRAAPNG